jgi:hypothetical protein
VAAPARSAGKAGHKSGKANKQAMMAAARAAAAAARLDKKRKRPGRRRADDESFSDEDFEVGPAGAGWL